MRTAINVILVVFAVIGGVWTLEGANIVGGSPMTGQPLWLYAGLVLTIVCIVALIWLNWRAPRPR